MMRGAALAALAAALAWQGASGQITRHGEIVGGLYRGPSLVPTMSKSDLFSDGRGVGFARPDAPDQLSDPAASAPRHARHVTRRTAARDDPSIDLDIEFRSGSADLTPQAAAQLKELGEALIDPKLAGNRFRIEGHTDTVGDDATNKALSTERAQAVTAYLERNYNIPAERLAAVGMGKDGLAVQTPDQTAEARNRRVHIVNLGG